MMPSSASWLRRQFINGKSILPATIALQAKCVSHQKYVNARLIAEGRGGISPVFRQLTVRYVNVLGKIHRNGHLCVIYILQNWPAFVQL